LGQSLFRDTPKEKTISGAAGMKWDRRHRLGGVARGVLTGLTYWSTTVIQDVTERWPRRLPRLSYDSAAVNRFISSAL